MLTEIPHIISPLTAPWCGWTMLVLMLFAILSEWLQPGVISKTTESLRTHGDRLYKEVPTNAMAQIFITLFRLGVSALALCLCFSTAGTFSFMAFLAVNGIIIGVLVLKMLCNLWIDYTFMLSRQFGSTFEHYSNIFTMISVALYPLLLVFLHIGTPLMFRWLLGIFAVLFLIVWLYCSARLYVRSPQAIVYLLIYFVTLECLPLVGVTLLSAKTISLL